jgi:hypothetical protein
VHKKANIHHVVIKKVGEAKFCKQTNMSENTNKEDSRKEDSHPLSLLQLVNPSACRSAFAAFFSW